MAIRLKVNGRTHPVEADPDTPLLWVLRDILDLKGTKYGCGQALCGACTVLIDGVATRSCATPVSAVTGAVTTVEALETSTIGRKVQAAWLELDVMQCGYCQAGQMMSAVALLAEKPRPTDQDIDDAMGGNLCRCATYTRIRAAIKKAAGLDTADTRAV
ncbi:MAG: (2Fe-2S)-binding protein [Caulobacteraceae bacterium]